MKKKTNASKLSLDKETIARLNEEQLNADQTQQVEGGATAFTAGGSCCGIGNTGTYTSCGK
ncbi:class I lanthipeptide [Emticicia sp. 17c]|uniref:class I lanthipeptide n=1 Tax=Emticicia sp. 17c TaxID=3127704 RepID=UPI00301D536E